MTVLTPFSFAAFISFHAITSVTAFSNSYDISFLSSIVNSHFSSFLLSTSLFTLLFKPENEKLCSLFTNHTLGNKLVETHHSNSYFSANLLIIGHPGYSSHIIFAALSNASPHASSEELPIFFISNIPSI
jgi:hypothetical protein